MAKIQGQKEGKHILIFTKKSGPNLGPWAQKSTMRFMRTLRPSLVALVQSSWSLVSNTLGHRIWSLPPQSLRHCLLNHVHLLIHLAFSTVRSILHCGYRSVDLVKTWCWIFSFCRQYCSWEVVAFCYIHWYLIHW